MKATKEFEIGSASVKVTLTRDIHADNPIEEFALSKKTYERYEVVLTHIPTGKIYRATGRKIDQVVETADIPAGAHAKLGNAYIQKPAYDAIIAAAAELDAEVIKTEEYKNLEAKEIAKIKSQNASLDAQEAEDAELKKHFGYCEKCGSYCYGDCQAN